MPTLKLQTDRSVEGFVLKCGFFHSHQNFKSRTHRDKSFPPSMHRKKKTDKLKCICRCKIKHEIKVRVEIEKREGGQFAHTEGKFPV